MDVLMLARHDWSNTGYRFSKCLEMLGLNVRFLKGNKHEFNYPNQGEICHELRDSVSDHPYIVNPSKGKSIEIHNRVFQNHEVNTINLKKRKEPLVGALAKEARVIHFHGSTFVENLDLSDKKVVVQHGGSTYRVDPNACNNIFNLVADATIIQCPDLLNLGAKNEHLIYYPVDTNLIQPDYNPKGSKIIIGHFPSNPLAKGTKGILRVIEKLSRDSEFKKRFKYVGAINHTGKQHQIPWKDHLERMAQCDIIIETMCLNYKGKKFGEWGNAAIESASLGKVVLTNSLTSDIYAKEYGNCALNIINNEEELESKLKRLLSVGQEELMQKKIETREWAVRNHSMTACARRLWNKVYKDFFPELTPSIL